MLLNIAQAQAQLSEASPTQVLEHALNHFKGRIACSFSGAEDVLMVHMAVKIDPKVRVFTLDTGRLHPQTYQFLEEVRVRYQIEIEVLNPNAKLLERYVKENGLFEFYENGHAQCCHIRKVEPLKRKLSTLSAWITGQRKDQSPNTRSELPLIQRDDAFSSEAQTLIKYNPLANLTSAEVWSHIRILELPYNRLHEQGFKSIGCEPCTRPTLPNQHEREGRWWWEEATKKECGLHLKQD